MTRFSACHRHAAAIVLLLLLAGPALVGWGCRPAHAPNSDHRTLDSAVAISSDGRPVEVAPAATLASSDRIASYTIRATLDPSEGRKTVTGDARIVWRNPSDVPVDELQFHLYLNAFRDRNSTFMRESGGQLRGDTFREGGDGNIEITSLTTASGEDLLSRLEFIHPDDDNADDRTVARVPLNSPVAPGDSIEIYAEFVDKLPVVFARTGYVKNFFLVAQWFPKLGVFEPRGTRGRALPGWNCHQFHANSEFYADFGTYDVEITTPEHFLVGATGRLVGETRPGDGTVTRRYYQADVHDFAWTADDNFVVGRRSVSRESSPPVEVTALVQPEHASLLDRHLNAAAAAITWFDREIGVYPYTTLTVVDPEEGAGGAGGMEYPTFVTAGVFSLSEGALPAHDDPLLEIVIFHEFAHQYWYGLVASNEFEEPWMDEGMTSYSELNAVEELWPDRDAFYFQYGGANVVRAPVPHPEIGRMKRMAALPALVQPDPIIRPAWGFSSDLSYAINSYSRPAITLKTLEGYLGRGIMRRVMRTYFERWKFGHPSSQDFFEVCSEVSGEDLSWFFDEFFRQSRVLDYAVGTVEATGSGTAITLERQGEAVFPVRARVVRADGTGEEIAWDGAAERHTFTVEGPVSQVIIDPENRVWLDANITNNSVVVSTDGVGPARVASQWALLFEHLMMLIAATA